MQPGATHCPRWAYTFLRAVATTAPACQILPITHNAKVLAFIADPSAATAADLSGVHSIRGLASFLVHSRIPAGAEGTLAAFTALLQLMLQVRVQPAALLPSAFVGVASCPDFCTVAVEQAYGVSLS